jgi:hypothetical protein
MFSTVNTDIFVRIAQEHEGRDQRREFRRQRRIANRFARDLR